MKIYIIYNVKQNYSNEKNSTYHIWLVYYVR